MTEEGQGVVLLRACAGRMRSSLVKDFNIIWQKYAPKYNSCIHMTPVSNLKISKETRLSMFVQLCQNDCPPLLKITGT